MTYTHLDSIRRSLEFAEQHGYSGVTVRVDALRDIVNHLDIDLPIWEDNLGDCKDSASIYFDDDPEKDIKNCLDAFVWLNKNQKGRIRQ